jgi:hypothetical protein
VHLAVAAEMDGKVPAIIDLDPPDFSRYVEKSILRVSQDLIFPFIIFINSELLRIRLWKNPSSFVVLRLPVKSKPCRSDLGLLSVLAKN